VDVGPPQMVFGAGPAPVDRRRTCVDPPFQRSHVAGVDNAARPVEPRYGIEPGK
jgi:hypothetical protein